MIDRIPVECIKVPKDKTYAFFYIVAPLIGPLLQKWENILTPLMVAVVVRGLEFSTPVLLPKPQG